MAKKPKARPGFFLVKVVVRHPDGKETAEWDYVPKVTIKSSGQSMANPKFRKGKE